MKILFFAALFSALAAAQVRLRCPVGRCAPPPSCQQIRRPGQGKPDRWVHETGQGAEYFYQPQGATRRIVCRPPCSTWRRCRPARVCKDIAVDCFHSGCPAGQELAKVFGKVRRERGTNKMCYQPACPKCRKCLSCRQTIPKCTDRACRPPRSCPAHFEFYQPASSIRTDRRTGRTCRWTPCRSCRRRKCLPTPCAPPQCGPGQQMVSRNRPDGCPGCPFCQARKCPLYRCAAVHCPRSRRISRTDRNGCPMCPACRIEREPVEVDGDELMDRPLGHEHDDPEFVNADDAFHGDDGELEDIDDLLESGDF